MRDTFKKLQNFLMGVKEDTPRPEFDDIPKTKRDNILKVANDKSRVLDTKEVEILPHHSLMVISDTAY